MLTLVSPIDRERGFGHKKGDPWVALASSSLCASSTSACAPRSKGIKIVGGLDDRRAHAGRCPHRVTGAAATARPHAEIGAELRRRLGRERDVRGPVHKGHSIKDPEQSNSRSGGMQAIDTKNLHFRPDCHPEWTAAVRTA